MEHVAVAVNWFKKVKQGLIDHEFHPSAIDPCLNFKKGMIIITYTVNLIIVSKSMKDINTFIKSMKDGPKGYVLTDEGDTHKFLGIEIKKITINRFELSQPFLIKRIVNLLGLGQNEFDVHAKTKITPVGNLLLNKDLEGKLRKKDWKYHTAIGMLTYLQGNLCPEMSMDTIRMATLDKFTLQTEHIALKYHHFCSHVKNGHIKIRYCPTEDQKADLLTKPLADSTFFRLRHMLIGW